MEIPNWLGKGSAPTFCRRALSPESDQGLQSDLEQSFVGLQIKAFENDVFAQGAWSLEA